LKVIKNFQLNLFKMLVTRIPTSNTSPDPAQGGLAVTTPSNTGHASTTASAAGDGIGVSEEKSCIWQGFPAAPAGTKTAIALKITHTSNGTRSGATATNQFRLEYSLNGGGAWNTAVSRINMTSAQGPTEFSVALPLSQDLTQVQVRDFMQATALTIGHSASAIVTISDIKIEVTTADDFALCGTM
jgi:hypothetical protein